MSVYKPKNSPFYHFDFQYRGDRFCGSTQKTEKRAAEAIEREERERAKAAAKVATHGTMTLDHAAQRYWHEIAQHQVGADNTKHDLAFLIDHFGKEQRLERLRELQHDEAARLDEVLRDDYRPLFDYAQATGQRKTACFALRWAEVSWDTHQIVRPRAKGGRPLWLTSRHWSMLR